MKKLWYVDTKVGIVRHVNVKPLPSGELDRYQFTTHNGATITVGQLNKDLYEDRDNAHSKLMFELIGELDNITKRLSRASSDY
jgi:hypothetical protein